MPAIIATNRNAYELWKAGMISATQIPINANWLQTTVAPNDGSAWATAYATQTKAYTLWNGCEATLHNLVLKNGVNAVRVFMDMLPILASNGVSTHDVSAVAANGWDDFSTDRTSCLNDAGQKTNDANRIPSYKLLATQIDNLLTLCQRLGMGLILCPGDFHSGGGGALWRTPQLQDDLVNFWDKTAERWANHPALIAIELINEPGPGADSMRYRDMQTGLNNYKALAERCIQKIRQHDTNTPVMVPGIQGGDPNGLAYFLDASVGLIQDKTLTGTLIDKVVYTVHVYTPSRYAQQGVKDWGYHATGLCYPNFVGVEKVALDGSVRFDRYDYNKTDSMGKYNKGMGAVFSGIETFRSQAPAYPIFIGEFSACSSAYLQVQSKGASNHVGPTAQARTVVGLNYDPTTDEGVLVMSNEINLYDVTDHDTYQRDWCRNTVNLLIQPLPEQPLSTIAPYDKFSDASNVALKGVTLEGNWYRNTDPGSGDANYLIRFKWPFAQKPSKNIGVSHMGPNGPLSPSELRVILFPANPALPPAQIASIQIALDDTQVKAQEASRQIFARDVLRQCARLGLSWSWYSSYSVRNQNLWGDKYWQVENAGLPLQGSNGQLARTLKRAAGQSYE